MRSNKAIDAVYGKIKNTAGHKFVNSYRTRMKAVSISKLPKCGLCNKLFIWARGLVFADINRCPHYTYGWSQVSPGHLLRWEKSKRLYFGEIRRDSIASYFRARTAMLSAKSIVFDPEVKATPLVTGTVYCFHILNNDYSRPSDPFYNLASHRDILRARLVERLTRPCADALRRSPVPVVGIHVRRGDFANFEWIQPIEVFCRMLRGVREIAGKDVPATVFTDGREDDVRPLLSMGSVSLAASNRDIVDMLLLSRSKLLITSRASTYSNWAAFLSDGVVLRDEKFSVKSARPPELDAACYEGTVSGNSAEWPTLAKASIRRILS